MFLESEQKRRAAHPSVNFRHPTFEFPASQGAAPRRSPEPYGDCLTYGPGHYETWAHWRRDRTVEPALRAIVRSYEYEDWPRGRIVFDQSRDLFIIYADRKLLTPATIARLETQFQLPEERTEIQSDLHYKSKETPNARYIDGISQPRKRISRKRRPLTWRSQIRGCAWWIAGGGGGQPQCNNATGVFAGNPAIAGYRFRALKVPPGTPPRNEPGMSRRSGWSGECGPGNAKPGKSPRRMQHQSA
jgi:hypothetical protein